MNSAHDLFEDELASAMDGAQRTARGLATMIKRVGSPDLRKQLAELRTASQEQVTRMKEIWELLSSKPRTSSSAATKGMLEDFSSSARKTKPKEALDVLAAHTGADLASYAQDTYDLLEKLGEKSGISHTAPKVSDLLKVSMKEAKVASKELNKLLEKLMEHVQPA